MRVAVFFVCLFLLLLGGYTYVYTGTHQNNAKPQLVVKPQQQKFTNTHQHYAVMKEADTDKEEEYLIGDNVEEEEDTENLSARKYRLLAGSYLKLPDHLRFLYSSPQAQLVFCNPLSYKYITQGVLRI